jgi:recombination protein RecR
MQRIFLSGMPPFLILNIFFMQQGIIENLITQLTKLPGIGRKSAQRLAFFILSMPEEDARSLSQAIDEVKDRARFCRLCFNITDSDVCSICSNPSRDRSRLCVVEEPSNILVIERSRGFQGLYHVLLGALSPIDGMTPDRLKMNELLDRVRSNSMQEIIIATNPNTKGEMTAQYIRELLKPFPVKVTRIAYGLPIGGDIEFADEVTLGKALEGRREM